ncbi:MAG: hypothetical protein V4547_16820 [Bacteroidota bacterium]
MNNETIKEENPLFPIARKLHNEHFLTWEYNFLHLTPENESTFILGFCGGVGHAASIFSKQIEELQIKVKELESIKAPTLERQDIVLSEENANTLHY